MKSSFPLEAASATAPVVDLTVSFSNLTDMARSIVCDGDDPGIGRVQRGVAAVRSRERSDGGGCAVVDGADGWDDNKLEPLPRPNLP